LPIPCELFLENMAPIKYSRKTAKSMLDHPDLDETIFLDSIDSTNMEARRRRSDFAHRNILLISDEQTAGIGQQGRRWESMAKLGLWMTLFLGRPSTLAHSLKLLSLYTGLILQHTVDGLVSKDIRLKWPNDIMIGSLKCGGVLTEIQWHGNIPISAIIGIGINLSHDSTNFPPFLRHSATSLQLAGWKNPDRGKFLDLFVGGFFQQLGELDTPDKLIAKWNSVAYKLNENVQWQTQANIIDGQFLGINQDGDALIRIGSAIRNFQNGEIRQLNPG